MLQLSLNGEELHLSHICNLTALLKQQGYQTQKIATAINGEFIPRSLYDEIRVSDGDQIDVIQAIGGG